MSRSRQAPAPSESGPGSVSGIDGLVEAWTRAWNAHDMRAAAALVDANVDFVTVAGLWLRGRDEFLRHHLGIHREHLRATTWATRDYRVRRLRDDLALAHLEWTIAGERDADGAPLAARRGVFTWVVELIGGTWLIAAAHNTNLRSDVSPRLATPGTL